MKTLNSFSVTVNGRKYDFRPCQWKDSTDAGCRWYAVKTHGKTGMEYGEQDSRKFHTKQECHVWAEEQEAMDAQLASEAQ